MKRFGFPILFSAIYVTAMFFVFSSDYSKENTFLYPKTEQEPVESPSSEGESAVVPLKKTPIPIEVQTPPAEEEGNKQPATLEPDSDHHSPEGSDSE